MVVGVVGSTTVACGMAKGRLSRGVQVAPLSVLFQSGRAPRELWNGCTNGKSTDAVVPPTQTSPVLSTATAAAVAQTLPPSAVSKIFVEPSGESLKTMAYSLPVGPNIFVVDEGPYRFDPAT